MSDEVTKIQNEIKEEIKVLVSNVQAEVSKTTKETVDQKAKLGAMEAKYTELHDKLSEIEVDNQQLKHLQNQFKNSDSNQKEKQEKAIKLEKKCFSDFLKVGVQKESFSTYMPRSDSGRELKELRTDIQEFGGYLVGTQYGSILESNRSELGSIAQDCNVVTLSAGVNSIEYPLDDDDIIQPTNVREGGGTSTTATEKISNVELKVNDLMRKVTLTTSILDDGITNVEQWIARKVARGFALKEEAQILSGTGVNQAKGILTYTADASTSYGAYTRDRIQHITSGAGDDIDSDTGLDSLIELLKASYSSNAKMYMHSTTAFRLLKLKDSDGRPLLDPDYSKNPNGKMVYRGYPISVQQSMPVIAANVFAIAFGDLKEAYTVVRKNGFKIIKDIYTDDNNVIVKTSQRFGGAVTNFEAVKVMKVAT